MVIYENLAVYKSAFDLCVYFEKIVKNFDKGHKFAIGADLKNKSRQIALQVIRANNSQKKSEDIQELIILIEELKLIVRLCQETNGFSNKLGPFSKVLGFLGVGNKISNDQMNVGQKKMDKYKAILDSFTKEELKNGPDFLTRSRMDRISKGSGTSLEEVKELSSHIKKMKKMFKGMDAKKMEGMAKQFQGQNGEIDPNNLDLSKIDMNQFANMKGVKKKKLRFR